MDEVLAAGSNSEDIAEVGPARNRARTQDDTIFGQSGRDEDFPCIDALQEEVHHSPLAHCTHRKGNVASRSSPRSTTVHLHTGSVNSYKEVLALVLVPVLDLSIG